MGRARWKEGVSGQNRRKGGEESREKDNCKQYYKKYIPQFSLTRFPWRIMESIKQRVLITYHTRLISTKKSIKTIYCNCPAIPKWSNLDFFCVSTHCKKIAIFVEFNAGSDDFFWSDWKVSIKDSGMITKSAITRYIGKLWNVVVTVACGPTCRLPKIILY